MSKASSKPVTPPRTDTGSDDFALRVGLFFASLFLVYGVHLMYFPVWLASRGLTPEQIGLVISVPIILRAGLTPAIALKADLLAKHREFIVGLSAIAALLGLVMSAAPGNDAATYLWILATAVPFAIAITSVLPLIDTIALKGATPAGTASPDSQPRPGGRGYGRMRLWGSLSFLAATLAAGAGYDIAGPSAIMWTLIAASFATAAAALLLPKPPIPRRDDGLPQDGHGVAHSETPAPPIVRTLLRSPIFLAFMLAVGTIQASHACLYTFGALHLAKQGVTGTGYGALWAIAILAETALFAGSASLVGRIGPVGLLVAGGAAAALRWAVMAVDPPYAALLGLQLLHAISFGATHIGAVHFIGRAVPGRGAGTAQAVYASVGNGLAMAGSTYVAGQIYPALGGGTYLVMCGLAIVGTAAAVVLIARWRGNAII